MSNTIEDYISWSIEDGEIDPDKVFECICWNDNKIYKVKIQFEELEE